MAGKVTVTEEDIIAAQLKALGVESLQMVDRRELVFQASVRLARATGKIPNSNDIARDLKLNGRKVCSYLNELADQGRMIRKVVGNRPIFIPIVA